MATTRHGLGGWGTRPAGSFSKAPASSKVTPSLRHGFTGWVTRPAGTFNKVPATGGKVTPSLRHGFTGWVTQPVGSFAGKVPAPEAPTTTFGGVWRGWARPGPLLEEIRELEQDAAEAVEVIDEIGGDGFLGGESFADLAQAVEQRFERIAKQEPLRDVAPPLFALIGRLKLEPTDADLWRELQIELVKVRYAIIRDDDEVMGVILLM